jgi:hypothetical protein
VTLLPQPPKYLVQQVCHHPTQLLLLWNLPSNHIKPCIFYLHKNHVKCRISIPSYLGHYHSLTILSTPYVFWTLFLKIIKQYVDPIA